jgi:hypothetical protein
LRNIPLFRELSSSSVGFAPFSLLYVGGRDTDNMETYDNLDALGIRIGEIGGADDAD